MTDFTPTTTVSETLDKASELLKTKGWTQGALIDHRGCMCALGAIGAAVVGPDEVLRQGYDLFNTNDLVKKTTLAVADLVKADLYDPEEEDGDWTPSYEDVYEYNDCRAQHVDDVTKLFARTVEAKQS